MLITIFGAPHQLSSAFWKQQTPAERKSPIKALISPALVILLPLVQTPLSSHLVFNWDHIKQ